MLDEVLLFFLRFHLYTMIIQSHFPYRLDVSIHNKFIEGFKEGITQVCSECGVPPQGCIPGFWRTGPQDLLPCVWPAIGWYHWIHYHWSRGGGPQGFPQTGVLSMGPQQLLQMEM